MMAAAWLRYQLTFKDMGFIFGGGALTVGCVRGRKRQQGTAFDLANGYVGVGEEGVELVHQVLAYKVGQVHLIEGVAQHW